MQSPNPASAQLLVFMSWWERSFTALHLSAKPGAVLALKILLVEFGHASCCTWAASGLWWASEVRRQKCVTGWQHDQRCTKHWFLLSSVALVTPSVCLLPLACWAVQMGTGDLVPWHLGATVGNSSGEFFPALPTSALCQQVGSGL